MPGYVRIPELAKKLDHLFQAVKGLSSSSERIESGPTELAKTLNLTKSYFSERQNKNNLPIVLDRYVRLRYGFGPADIPKNGLDTEVWRIWDEQRPAWRRGSSAEFCNELYHRPLQPRPFQHQTLVSLRAEIGSLAKLKAFQSNGELETDEERDRLNDAFAWINSLSIKRRGTGVPTISHLIQVCGIVLENDGTIDQAIAALLHDVLEDYEITFEQLNEKFGYIVASIVQECSDREHQTPSIEKFGQRRKEWMRRKVAYLDRFDSMSESALRIVTADKLHNCRAMYRDARVKGSRLWRNIKRSPEDTAAYFIVASDKLRELYPSCETNELCSAAAAFASSIDSDLGLAKSLEEFRRALAMSPSLGNCS